MKNIKYYLLFVLGKLRRHFFMQYPETERDWKISRIGYLVSTAAATAISSLMAGTFITALLLELGMSDALNGVFSNASVVASLTALLMVQITNRIGKVKLPTVLSCLVGRLIYSVLVFVPFFDMPSGVRTMLFLVLYIIAQFLFQFVNPCSSAWLYSLIPSTNKGKFISIRDTLSMVSGGVFSLVGSGILDYYTAQGDQRRGFVIIGIMIFILTVINIVFLNMCMEPKKGDVYLNDGHEAVGRLARRNAQHKKSQNVFQMLAETLRNTDFRKVIFIYIFWFVANYTATTFLNIYYISDLGFKYTFINGITLLGKVVCVIVFPYAGKLADKISYMFIIRVGTVITALSYFSIVLCRPGNFAGVIFVIYQILYLVGTGVWGIGMAAVLYGTMPDGDSAKYFAVYTTYTSVIGIIFTVLGGVVLDFIQKSDITLFGTHIYAQQILGFAGGVVILILMLYLRYGCNDLEEHVQRNYVNKM